MKEQFIVGDDIIIQSGDSAKEKEESVLIRWCRRRRRALICCCGWQHIAQGTRSKFKSRENSREENLFEA